jgi:DNA-directed RNA polymerase specialized sigma24 family protein
MTQSEGPAQHVASATGSVTGWLGDLKCGGDAAAQLLWERYFHRLVGLARKHINGACRRMADEEDVALNAFNSFFAGVARGRFPQLNDRDDLWRILIVLTERKAAGLRRHQTRRKRGGKARDGISPGQDKDGEIDQLADPTPTAGEAVLLVEECRRRLEGLGDATLRRVAELRMAGYSIVEVAEQLGVTKVTIDRKLAIIRRKWTDAQTI